MVKGLQKSLKQIKRQLLSNESIRKLLYYGGADALQKADVGPSEVTNIHTTPALHLKKDNDTHCVILIYPESLSGSISPLIRIRIGIYANLTGFKLDNDEDRVLSLSEEVVKQIKNLSLPMGGTMEPLSMNLESLGDKMVGYTTVWQTIST